LLHLLRPSQRLARVAQNIAHVVHDLAHDAVAVDHERAARRDGAIFDIRAVGAAGRVLGPVAEQRELEFHLVGEGGRSVWCIDADAQNLGTGLRDLVLDLAEAIKFVRSATAEGEGIEGEDHGLLAAEALQAHLIAAPIWKGKIRRLVADLNGHN
jgi:hypothetical protein